MYSSLKEQVEEEKAKVHSHLLTIHALKQPKQYQIFQKNNPNKPKPTNLLSSSASYHSSYPQSEPQFQ